MSRRILLTLLVFTALLVGACASAASAPAPDGGVRFSSLDSDTNVPVAAPDQSTPGVTADQQLIVRTGSMALIVKDVPAAVAAAQTTIIGLGGHVAASQTAGDKDQPTASVTYRIPAARFDDALVALRALGLRVVAEQTQSNEVTGQVLDLAARLGNLRTTELALQAIMLQATKIPDVLAVQQQLTDVQGQIEQLTAEKANLENQAALSTLSVNFAVEIPASQTASSGWDPGKIADGAVSQLISLGQGVATFFIEALIVGVPVVLGFGLLGLLAFGLWRLVRRLRRRGVIPVV